MISTAHRVRSTDGIDGKDAVGLYLDGIAKTALLTAVEEVILAKRIEAGLFARALLEGTVATFECFNRSRYEEGDHVIFVGEVERCQHHGGMSPLLYHGGRFYTEHPL